ncbi:hypothetical protein AAC387_Pa10g0344 [Persea americana]
MAPDKHVFRISGPQHLTHVNWKNPDHRRSVAATLVQGAYILEHDRQQNRCGSEALATPWWEFFHFQLIRTLIDDADYSIFGAIYELKSPAHLAPEAPKYVIAFRGTIIDIESISRDLKLDLHVIQNDLHCSSRFEIAMQAIEGVVSAGDLNVWLAGHSLGSAVAMLAGKKMAKMGVLLEAFLFNPPFISAPIERIKDKKLKQGIRIAGSFITAGLAVAVKAREGTRSTEWFAQLASWVPCLFVNPADHICSDSSEYVGYFEHRKKMEEIGAAGIGRLATRNSIVDIFLSALGKESEPLHLLPSAKLSINMSPSPDFKKAHGIHQWWRPDCQLKCMLYHYK